MEIVLKGKSLEHMEEVKYETAEALKAIKSEEFKNYFEQWKHLDRCITSNGQHLKVTGV